MTMNPTVLSRIEKITELVKPEKVIWIDGSEKQLAELRRQAAESGIVKPLNPEKLPGCILHRTSINDAAKTEQRTFICTEKAEDAGPSNNWLSPDAIIPKLSEAFDSVMAGRTMYVVPFCLGSSAGLGLYRAGIEITDSIYVVLNTAILAKCGRDAVNVLNLLSDTPENENGESDWYLGVHSTGTYKGVNPNPETKEDNRYICHFPQAYYDERFNSSVWAINTGYGTNAFLTKKALALRLASFTAKEEGWLAEHMLILELESPDSEPVYIAAAFPTGCGKTNLAMLEVPELYAKKGYRVRCISEDVAWLKKGEDGRLWAINPEAGVFGAAPGVNALTSPNVLATASKNAIFTNVGYNLDDDTVWWEGLDGLQLNGDNARLLDWKGNEFKFEEIALEVSEDEDDEVIDEYPEPVDDDEDENGEPKEPQAPEKPAAASKPVVVVKKGAHPNSRFTAPITGCPSLSERFSDPQGVPISAIVFGGRRSKAVPLVFQAFDWEHGVFVGSVLGTEPVMAPGTGSPSIRRDPMAMNSYCGYNMADYWQHWLKMGKKLGRNAPKIFNVNWFKVGEDGTPAWPGFGENIRVLDWILRRIKQKCSIIETPVGYSPKIEDIDIDGLELTPDIMKWLLGVDKTQWKEDVNSIKQFYGKFGDKLPVRLKEQLIDLEKRLLNS